MWPSLWALNPQITNPHWIFPGDVVFLDEAARPDRPRTGTMTWSGSRYAQDARPTTIHVRRVGFIAAEEYQESGRIEFSRETKGLLSMYDEVYVEFAEAGQIAVGEDYTIYRTDREIEHPVSEEPVGHLVRFIGVLKVLDNSKPLHKCVILGAFEEIERGDLVSRFFEPTQIQSPQTNQTHVEGTIIANYEDVELIGQFQYVFVDRGANHGVRPGNRFLMQERGDPYIELDDEVERNKEDFPWEYGGELMVVEVYEDHSLAIVTESIHDFKPGQSVIMIQGY
jgi:hypothetical protein